MGDSKKDIKEIRNEVDRLRVDLKGLMRSISDLSRTEASEAKAKAEAELQGTMQQLNRRYQELRVQSADIAGKARDTVEERPVASMLIALAAGALLGGIVSRK